MEERWTTVCRKLTLIGFLIILVHGQVVSKKGPKTISLFYRHSNCIPILFHNGRKINSTFLPAGGHMEHVTLQFHAFGRPFTVDLSINKNLFSTSYVERVFQPHSQGQSEETSRSLEPSANCFYHGHLRFQPESKVAISTCNGFRGYISDRRDTYHIEPWKGMIHHVYRDKDERKLPFRCGTDGHDSRLHSHKEILNRRKRSVRAPYDSNKNTRYVELYLVNDYRTYERHGKNRNVIIQRSQDIANIVSSLYRQLNIYVALVGVEVWGAGDLISITTSADNTMENFLRYRKERINPFHHNDNAHLITGVFFDHGVVGKAIKGPICTHQFSGGVNMDYGGIVTHVATTVAHEMGHNFGMQHDNDTTCECRDDKCIMAATSGQISPCHWSSCSQNALAEAFDLGMDYCLRNIPEFIFNGPICGNGFKEDGEDCDCGLSKDCTNRCCNPFTCTLHPQAECATGRCCDLSTCKPKKASILCREPTGECDLGEFCNGTSEFCPPDVYVHNGKPCMKGQSYCYKGECNTHTKQCKLLWGDSGRVSDPICFQQLNMNGNKDGSCGYNLTTRRYQRCNREDVMCGLLHCVHLNEKLMFWRDNLALEMRASFLTRGNQQYVCRSAMLDVGLDMHDPGFVPDGAKCEDNKICINQKCTALAKLDVKSCPDNCLNHGTCNSNGNCHCDVGYAPPLCDHPGSGGSLDSGPASDEYAHSSPRTSTQAGREVTTGSNGPNIATHTNTSDSDDNKDLLIALLVVFLLVIPIIILLILGYINRQRLWKWWRSMPSVKDRVKKNQYKTRPPRPTPTPNPSQPRRDLPPPYPSETMAKPYLNAATSQNSRIWNPSSGVNKPPGRPMAGPKTSGYIHSNSPTQKPLLSVPVQETEGPPSTGKNKKYNQTISAVVNHNSDTNPSSSRGVATESDVANSPKTNQVIKRDSFRGADISYPVLKSTTNRNSVVENLHVHVDIIGPEANKSPSSPSSDEPKSSTVRRSYSDRSVPHPDPSKPSFSSNKNNTLKKSASTKTPRNFDGAESLHNSTAEPEGDWGDNERIYCNEIDQDDLVSSINKTLGEDSIYRNVSDEVDLHKPVQDSNPPALPSRASKYKDNKSNSSGSNNLHNNLSAALQFNIKNSSGQTTSSTPNKFNKPSPPVKSLSTEVKTPQTKNSLVTTSNQSKTSKPFSRPKPSTSVSSPVENRATKEAPALPRKPLMKSSSLSSSETNPQNSVKMPGPKVLRDSNNVKEDSARTSSQRANVSNLAAKFSQNSDSASPPVKESIGEKGKPVVKRTATVSGSKPSVTERPSLSAKPVESKAKPQLAPRPREQQERKPVPPKPASTEVKRVRSFKI